MSNTYNWFIDKLDVTPSVSGQIDVVNNAYWYIEATDGVNIVKVYGNQRLSYTAGEPFVPYSNLTQEQVLEWVKAKMGVKVAAMETVADTRLTLLSNPPIITPNLPWSS